MAGGHRAEAGEVNKKKEEKRIPPPPDIFGWTGSSDNFIAHLPDSFPGGENSGDIFENKPRSKISIRFPIEKGKRCVAFFCLFPHFSVLLIRFSRSFSQWLVCAAFRLHSFACWVGW